MLRFVFAFLILLPFINYTILAKEKKQIASFSAEEAYCKGEKLFQKKKYRAAAEQFFNIFIQSLGSDIATKSEFMHGYSLYLAGEYAEAFDILERFIRLHPMYYKIADVYYLKASAKYKQAYYQQDLDQLARAKSELQQVIDKFPESDYVAKVQEKINVLSKNLASIQMDIGKFYLARKNPIAALNRFNTVIDQYSHTSYYPEAIYRMAQSYALLECKTEIEEQLAILNSKFPDNIWSKRAKLAFKAIW
ncbi:outer membrane assembly lipoYfiO family protein [Orientia chuto str. Dubai]|uniref:Outer membrane assembly lipoYfiO family protein n=1 Tax=Orientia chuto str. Dubai TaxID=1359168 RepID=A0A0F3MN46_9RICK|nr:outer membrane protein assembly factor BamD [Candidatus Orientia mediorientalis]KJV57150.1 outer membrane assembly lipoYfiO family protein [Orientia chuto str. Dubai]